MYYADKQGLQRGCLKGQKGTEKTRWLGNCDLTGLTVLAILSGRVHVPIMHTAPAFS